MNIRIKGIYIFGIFHIDFHHGEAYEHIPGLQVAHFRSSHDPTSVRT